MLAKFLTGIEGLAPVKALKVSFLAYPLVNALHILAIGVLVTTVLLMDLRILGLFGSVERTPLLRLLRRIIAAVFPVAVLTGLALFSIRAHEYAVNPAFQVKLVLIVLAGLNLLAFSLLAPGDPGEKGFRTAAKISAALSMVIWIGVLVAGRFIAFL